MKKLNKLVLLFCLITMTVITNAQISGTVFRDFNGNGVKDNTATFNEPFVAGVTVTATLSNGTTFTTTTSAVGAYSFTAVQIPATSAVRIEFSGLGLGDYNSFNGTGNGTNVQFATAPNAATNYAINAPEDYWNNTTQAVPGLVTIAIRKGATSASPYAGQFSAVQINNGSSGPGANPANSSTFTIDTSTNRISTAAQTGSLFGLASQKKQQRLFASAYLRRSVWVGPRGLGGVYIMDKSGANFSLTGSFDLNGVTPSNGGGVLDFGSVTRNTTTPNNDNYISNATQFSLPGGSDSRDIDAFSKAGTVSFGDIEADPNSDNIYMINLFQRRLIVFNASATTATLNGATAATLTPFTTAFNMTTLPGWPTATGVGNSIRPYAVKIYKGRGYIGVVSDAMATQNPSDLRGYVLQFDPGNIAAGFTTVITINFSSYTPNYWRAWPSTWAQAGGNATSGPRDYPNPIIAGIEFNEDGSMDIGIKDRWGDQGGMFDFVPFPSASNGGTPATGQVQTSINGDLLHACRTAIGWALEGTSGSCDKPAANLVGTGSTNNFGNGYTYNTTTTEWYSDRSGDGGFENSIGGMTKIMGTGNIISTVYDPMAAGGNSAAVDGTGSGVYWSTMGVQWNNVTTGAKAQIARVIPNAAASLDKSNGMGDIEAILDPAPIQIGNRIWLDANGNGVQDAGETTAGVPTGTTVTLRSPGVDGIYGNGDDQTWTTTTDANGNYYFSALSSADTRRPSNWIGIGNTLLPGYNYRIEVATPSGTQVTNVNAASNTVDNIDNDAVANGTNAFVTFNTGNTNHNFDIGFKSLASIGDRVWLDNGVGSGTSNDGVQNGTEPGVAGVTVTLYQNGADGLPGTADDVVIGSTVTDAFGNYLFDNLTPSTSAATSYNVGFTLPANHQFTTQTNTQVTGTSNATNTTTTSGGSTAANGSDANTTTGRTGSFWLAPGEAERGADAGLIFNTPTLLNSIGDRVWFDNGLGGGTAGNGVQDGTEPGVAGVTVQLLDDVTGAVIATTITDANGNYIFTGLPANTNYKVKVIPPAGTVFTTTTGTTPGNATTNSDVNATLTSANYGTTATVNTGAAGTQITGIDAGLVSQAANTASLGDRVWNDLNSNGTQDAAEPGIAGVTVNLYEDANGDGVLTGGELIPVRTSITDAFGNYNFNNLVVTGTNRWQVEFVQPSGFNNTPVANNNSGNDATDSDIINNTTDRTGFIRLKFDERNTTVDAGFVQAAPAGSLVLGDRVWRDNNANGQQDATEPGVAGVTAKLYQNGPDGLPGTADDVLVGTTTTDINGNYQFVNLAASTNAATNYNVQFSNLPSGFVFTTQDAGADASDSDVNALGVTNSINLTANNQTIDAGITQGIPSGLGSLGDKVWYDLDNDGVQDAGELGVAGVAVNLFRDANNDGIISGAELTPIATTTTNPLGEYMFTSLPAGTYQVGFTLPAALNTYALSTRDAVAATDATDSDGNPKNTSIAGNTAGAQTSYTGLIALGQGQDNVTVDLGIVPPANTNTLGGTAWFDTDSDGSQTGNPGRVPGVLVTLYNSAGVAIATTTTDENGDYLFVGLADGDYSVGFSNYPAGFDVTTKSATNDATGSDADRVSGRTPTVTLNAGNRNDRSLDAGLISTRAALGNRVWDDLNGDGIQDAGEPGIAGVQVILYASDGITVLASTITDQNGNYLFANLGAGNYIVGVNSATIPAGMQFTTQNNTTGPDGDGANTWTGGGDSDVTNAGFTATITLAAGQVNLTVDAGVRRTPTATVGNRVWDDLNSNGIQDAGEPGVSGVVATLYNSANQPIGSAVTDGNGNWLITNVPTGTGYYVIFTNKPAGNWTLQDQGANGTGTGGATESDADSDVNTTTGQTGTFDVTPNTINVKIDAGILQSITLPVKYTSFIANKSNNTSLLSFTIAQPAPGSTFTIERSVTGTSFTAIGTITGANATSYTYTDIMPVLTTKNYYRIKEVDAQGKVSYSEIRMVKFTKDGKVDIYPIPAATNLSITFGDEVINKPIVISLYNQQGQELMRKQISRANATEIIDIANYANGTYQLRVTSNTELITNRKVVIMK